MGVICLKRFKWLLIFLGFAPLFFPSITLASTLSLSPGGGNVYVGGTKSVSVVLNTGGEAVNAVSAVLSYPTDKLEVAWVSGGGSFPIQAENTYGGGIIKISRGSFTGVNGGITVATIAFRGKAAGSATVSFIGGSQAPRLSDSSDSLNLGGSRGGVYTVGGSAPKQEANSETGSNSGNVAVVISDLKTSLVSTNSATVSWKTNVEADTAVDYGLNTGQYFLTVSSDKLVIDHEVKLESPLFTPGLLIHFKASSKTEGGSASSNDTTIQLPGYNAKIKLTDSSGKPIVGASVILYSNPLQGVTDQNGEVSFQNITPGKHMVLVKIAGIEKSSEIEVKESTSLSVPQVFTVAVAGYKTTLQNNFRLILFFGVIVATIVILAIAAFLLSRKFNSPHPPPVNKHSSGQSQFPPSVTQERKL